MATYLLLWNPKKWEWETIQQDISKIDQNGSLKGGWSCGRTKKIKPDDRFFLMRLGKEPKGICASGRIISSPTPDEHWDNKEGSTYYVEVEFETILDPNNESIFLIEKQKGIYKNYNWTPQSGGRTIPHEIAEQLQHDWSLLLAKKSQTLDNIFLKLDYHVDTRQLPDHFRRERFKIGWEDATSKNKSYSDLSLKQLTWQNLGYRIGKVLGHKSSNEIYKIFEYYAYNYKQKDEEILIPEEISEVEGYFEGSMKRISVNIYERNNKAREKCIKYYGVSCYICGFNFEEKYGEIGRQFIHVHHLKQLSEIREGYQVDPIEDLRPVCPNCHAMLHRKNPSYSIDELKEKLKNLFEIDN